MNNQLSSSNARLIKKLVAEAVASLKEDAQYERDEEAKAEQLKAVELLEAGDLRETQECLLNVLAYYKEERLNKQADRLEAAIEEFRHVHGL